MSGFYYHGRDPDAWYDPADDRPPLSVECPFCGERGCGHCPGCGAERALGYTDCRCGERHDADRAAAA